MDSPPTWKRCSSCKKEIGFESEYYLCSVSTCTRKRTGFFFCSEMCWDAHLPMMRHREAWAIQKRAPTQAEHRAEQAAEAKKAQERVERAHRTRERAPARPQGDERGAPREVLVVISKLKKYVKSVSGMNTSDKAAEALSEHVRAAAREAIRNAGRDGRRTVLERDIPEV